MSKLKTITGKSWMAEVSHPEVRRPRRGMVYINSPKEHLYFIEEQRSYPRSREICRTRHGRCVLRRNGMFSVSLQFKADEASLLWRLRNELHKMIGSAKDYDEMANQMNEQAA